MSGFKSGLGEKNSIFPATDRNDLIAYADKGKLARRVTFDREGKGVD